MTQHEEDAAIGYRVRKTKELQDRLANLKTEAYRIGDELLQAGKTLQGQPQNIWLDGLSTNVGQARADIVCDAGSFDVRKIAKLTNEIRDVMEELERLKQQG